MSGFLTTKINDRVLDCLFGGQELGPSLSLYVGLSLLPARRDGRICEPTGPSYRRVRVPNNLLNFPAAEYGAKWNACPIEFPLPLENWGRVQSVFLADAPGGGSVIAGASLGTPRDVDFGQAAPMIPARAMMFHHI